MAGPSAPSRPYVSRGQVLQRYLYVAPMSAVGANFSSPPLTVRIQNFIHSIYMFLGLYLVSLFSMDPYTSAQNSRFNAVSPPKRSPRPIPQGRYGGSGGGGGGGGGGPGGPGGPSKRIGRVDDVRGPECRSCG
ncbi:hypothetical protein D8B26_005304 [Coccidioides posadasii str. Silveira]|nr:hypothetical protein D8B26_005304 [Coccidioides posadasii str. Silveira]